MLPNVVVGEWREVRVSLLEAGIVIGAIFAGACYLYVWALCRAVAQADARARIEPLRPSAVTQDEPDTLQRAA
jgi:hypothetical protein